MNYSSNTNILEVASSLIVQGVAFTIASIIPGTDPKNENMLLIRTLQKTLELARARIMIK